jgi:hypothetical protein
VAEPLRTADGHEVHEGLYLQDGRTLYKVSTCYERQVALQVCLDRGELTTRTRVRQLAAGTVTGLRVANQGLVGRYHNLLDKPGRALGPMQPHGFEQLEGATGSKCRFCGLDKRNPVHRGEGPL